MKTKIEWTDQTWNPVTGCDRMSEGCANCYAAMMSRRLQSMGLEKYKNGFSVALHEESLEEPLHWKSPSNIFVCSMSDLFNEKVPFAFVDKVFNTIRNAENHRFQILTKRAERMERYFVTRKVPDNVWIGVTVESAARKERIDVLRRIKARVRFLSCEPLLSDLGRLNLKDIHWVIVGGESGPKARPMQKAWVESIQKQAARYKSAFFFKQWGAWGFDGVKRSKAANGKLLNGKICQAMPDV
ncbi:MAG: phage Gp37/Gp68 family protein [Fibrobacterales bacterium]|nr:phage Gp37/Gp68 family protein [Fibrobacterales bacterium]